MTENSSTNKSYGQGHSEAVLLSHRSRTVDNSAGFLVPHIKETDVILDLGSGPGTITVGLAKLVPKGKVIGIDLEPDVVSHAAHTFPSSSHPNLSFQSADILSPSGLPFPSNTFDIVYTSQVILHLPDPIAGIREAYRVLKPGGILAMRETLGFTWYPSLPGLELYDRGLDALIRKAGSRGLGTVGGMKGWAREAGFEAENVKMGGGSMVYDTKEEREFWADGYTKRLDSGWGEKVGALEVVWPGSEGEGSGKKLIGDEGRDLIKRDVKAWAEHPDGWFCGWQCEVIARK